MPKEEKEEARPSGNKDAKGEGSFKKVMGGNQVECNMDTMKHVD